MDVADDLIQQFGLGVVRTLQQTRKELLEKIQETEDLLLQQLQHLQLSLRGQLDRPHLTTQTANVHIEQNYNATMPQTKNLVQTSTQTITSDNENSNLPKAIAIPKEVKSTQNPDTTDSKAQEKEDSEDDDEDDFDEEDNSDDQDDDKNIINFIEKPKNTVELFLKPTLKNQTSDEVGIKTADIINSKRIISAFIFKSIKEIQSRQDHEPPKKFKNSFSGRAAVSYLLESFGFATRSDAVTIATLSLNSYINCVSHENSPFRDDENYFFDFKFPVFVVEKKLETEIKESVNVLLMHNRKLTKSDSGSTIYYEQTSKVIKTKAILMKAMLELCYDKKGKKWHTRLCLLYAKTLKIYKTPSDAEPVHEIKLKDFRRLSYDEYNYDIMDYARKKSSEKMPFIATYLADERRNTLMFRVADDKKATAQWVLGIDGLKYQDKPLLSLKNACCLDNSTKLILLRMLYKDSYKGAVLKNGVDDWYYTDDGLVVNGNESDPIKYNWTGEILHPALSDNSKNLGTGRWDGANLWWFPASDAVNGVKNPSGNFYHAQAPSQHYIYNANEREYLCGDSDFDWKWTRHFLASKGGDKEWIIEGFVPDPVVMLLQMLCYHLRKPKDSLGTISDPFITLNKASPSLAKLTHSGPPEIGGRRNSAEEILKVRKGSHIAFTNTNISMRHN